jgi:single-stranded-DNA-specific exonuclease
MTKRWVLKQDVDPKKVKELSESLNINKTLAKLLVQRNIHTFEEARNFFRPNLEQLHDPFLMKDMEKAVSRIEEAIKNKEKILVYGDYDVDGTTAVALVYTFFKDFHNQIGFYIPDRYSEGYGISYKSIDFAAENDYKLVIALDCGIKAVEKVQHAKEKGLEFIICDHHRPGDTIPPAVAVLDAKRPDCNYPYDELSGCGVGFKLIQAYSQKYKLPFDNLVRYLDLVVVSIASDIVPITGENRILAYYGLKLLNSNPRPGLQAILNLANLGKTNGNAQKITRNLGISDLVFMVGPRINAAGRIETGNNSVELLIAEKPEEAGEMADLINECNNERRSLDSLTTTSALDKIGENEDLRKGKATIVYDPEWHKGVIGIVASRLTEVYYKPTIVFCKSNGLITGSARSVKDFDIYDAIDACSDLLEHFGGHKYAAGLSLKPENLEAFQTRFMQIVEDTITEEMMIPEIEIDAEINLTDISPKFFRILRQFAPFGPGNMSPVFRTRRLIDTGFSRIVGKNHIKLSVVHPHISGFPVSGIAFQLGDHFDVVKSNQPFSLCYHLEENEWNGKVSLQLNVKDIKPDYGDEYGYPY